MAKWANSKLQDDGLNYLKANCDKVVAILAYTAGDTYATVTGGANLLSEVDAVTGDFVLSGAAGAARVCTWTPGGTDALANASGNPTHFAFLRTGLTEVIYVTEETSAVTLTSGVGPVTFPTLTYTANQPT